MAQSQITPRTIAELKAAYAAPTSQFNPADITNAYATGSTLADTIASKSLERQKAEQSLKQEIFNLTEAQNKKSEEDKAAQLLQPVTSTTPVSSAVPATAGNVANVNPDTNAVEQTPDQIQAKLDAERGPALKGLALKLNPTAIAPALFGVQKTPQIAVNRKTGASRIVQPDANGNFNIQPGEELKDLAVAGVRADSILDKKTNVGVDSTGQPLFANGKGEVTTSTTPNGQPILPKSATQQTAAVRDSAAYAKTLLPHIQQMRDTIAQADAKGYIGPAAGRVYGEFLTGKVGSTGNADADQLLGNLRAQDSLLKSGALKVHFGSRGGQAMYEHFSDILNSGKQSAQTLNGALNGVQEFIQGYADAGGQNPLAAPAGGGTPPPADIGALLRQMLPKKGAK